jgi:4'-phosphopantetheinyl transferase
MWSAPPAGLRLRDGEIHVWRAELNCAETGALLDERERARAARLRFERDRLRFIAAHSALRRVLALYLCRPPETLRFAHTELGKPWIEGPFRFSMSHSGDVALYAIALGEVGVDLEQVREGMDVRGIAERFLPAEEVAELRGLEPDAERRAFFRLWTRREAYLKARGIGIRGVGEAIGPGWFIAGLDPVSGYEAAVAIEAPEARVLTWDCPRAISETRRLF